MGVCVVGNNDGAELVGIGELGPVAPEDELDVGVGVSEDGEEELVRVEVNAARELVEDWPSPARDDVVL